MIGYEILIIILLPGIKMQCIDTMTKYDKFWRHVESAVRTEGRNVTFCFQWIQWERLEVFRLFCDFEEEFSRQRHWESILDREIDTNDIYSKNNKTSLARVHIEKSRNIW